MCYLKMSGYELKYWIYRLNSTTALTHLGYYIKAEQKTSLIVVVGMVPT